ncbi:Cadmium/zinc-transporting ATPase HMA2 [Hibiscus syriacus]|uniref:Cadmium/zinc-transporting ATPase HMA2 n=1 Tax=Hibiscus syriacus TaxID=106335 RepID=A0A6A2Y6W7_HIBSY|nr:Cadmium/zinc-transporting ATPase HMA2 [Hibiscus syriacus]
MGENDEKKLQKSYFDVLGLCCSSEVPLIENILKSIEGVKQVSVIVPTRTVIVLHDNLLVSQTQIGSKSRKAGSKCESTPWGDKVPKEMAKSQAGPDILRTLGQEGMTIRAGPAKSFCSCLRVVTFDFLFKYVYRPLQWVAVAAEVVGSGVIGSLVMKDYIEAATIVFLFTTAEWLESRAIRKAAAVMWSLMSISPQKPVIAESGEFKEAVRAVARLVKRWLVVKQLKAAVVTVNLEEVDADQVELNTVVAVKACEVIPIDGIVVDGECEVDEKTLTAEPLPVPKQKGSTVWSSTINLNGYTSVKTTVVAKMAKLVEEAQNSKSTTQRFIDKCAQFYSQGFNYSCIRVHNLHHWFQLALVVLVSACPCVLILSTPVATFCALTRAATSGILVKGGDYLETLSKINITAFDKTGTLTRGEFVVTDFRSLSGDVSLNTLLHWVSSIESKSSHPMEAALIEYGRSHSIEPKLETVEDYQNFPGEVGIFSLSDACRTGAAEAVNELKSMGIKTALLTGDNQTTAMNVQEQFKKEGTTSMVGDGINDASTLATADIGISMGFSGSALKTETGHVILMSNDIRKISKANQLERKARSKVIKNVVLSISSKAAILASAEHTNMQANVASRIQLHHLCTNMEVKPAIAIHLITIHMVTYSKRPKRHTAIDIPMHETCTGVELEKVARAI